MRYVDAFPRSSTRRRLFDLWQLQREAITEYIAIEKQLLDGSFVTDKEDPGDVDVVTLLDGVAYDSLPMHRRMTVWMLASGGHRTRDLIGCDSFVVSIFPNGHAKHQETVSAEAYWEDWWGHAPPDHVGIRTPKGYLEVR